MEKVFESLLGESADLESSQATSTEESTETVDALGEDYNLQIDDENESETSESVSVTIEDDNETPSNKAFAQMRVQNKEYADKIKQIEAAIQSAGLKDIDEFLVKTKEAQIKKSASEQGISEELAKELQEMRDFREDVKKKEIANAQALRESTLVNNLQDFITKNNLSEDVVKGLSDNLEKDGFSLDYLMDLPKGALNRILSSYVGGNQKYLERKEAVRNELPTSQSSKASNDTLQKEIDKLAREFAGKY